MAKNFTKILCAFLAFVMCLGTVPAFAIESTPELTAEEKAAKWPIDKTANGLDENDQTDVTLTVPGIVEGYIDVVFILGGGMTANKTTVTSAINVFKPAMESGKATVRVGLIALEKGKEIILDLNSDEAVLNPDTYIDFLTKKIESITELPAGTTNLHSQLLEAQKMLKKETKASAENKYLFVLATGRTYWFDNEAGDQSVVLLETPKLKNATGSTQHFYSWSDYIYRSLRSGNTGLYMVNEKYKDDWDAYWADICARVKADGDKYVYTPGFDQNDINAFSTWSSKNGAEWRALYNNGQGSRYGNIIVNPAPTANNFVATGIVDGIPYDDHTNHAINYERAMYECVQVWQELVDAEYNCYSICSENVSYQNNSLWIKQSSSPYTGASTTQLGHSFMNYLATLAGQEYAPTVFKPVIENGILVDSYLDTNFFASVLDDSLYTTSIGTTVEDYIGKNDNGNFEFIQDPTTIKLVVGGNEYETEQIDTKEGATASYQFTRIKDKWDLGGEDPEPTFWLDYYYGDGETTERFVWTFGENVSMENLATLTYKLQLTEKLETEGTYKVPTNNSAILYPIYSNGKEGTPQVFPVPEVEYEVVPYDVDIVLALGAGIAQYQNTYDSIVSLVEKHVNKGIRVKLGFVAVEHYTEKAMDLTLLTKDNYKSVIQRGLDIIQSMPAGPTNLEGVIAEAHAMLTAESEKTVPSANKFFYVIATGRTYCFDDAEGNPATTLNSVKIKGDTYYYWGHYAWQSQRGRHTSLYLLPNGNDWDAYWEDVVTMNKADIAAGDEKGNGKYDYTMPGDYSESDWYVGNEGFFTNNSTDAKAMGLGSSRYGWIIKGLTDKEAIGSGANPGHAMAYDRGQYEAWVAYEAMKGDGINCYAICSESTSYQNGSPYIKNVAKYNGTTTMQVGHSFMNFLAGGEATLLFQLTDPNTGASEMLKDFFNEANTIEIEDLVKSNTVTKTLTFSEHTVDVTASTGDIASFIVEAEGDGLTYAWYYKTSKMSEFELSSFTGNEYNAVMSGKYDEQQIYCVVTDQYGNTQTTETVALTLE